MLLKTLTLRNYRKYKDASVEFPDGVIGIIGLNGVGKTTLVEAIGWALFGHHAARTTKELIKREGASLHEPCSVNLEFELESDRYTVAREMSGKNLVPKASLKINGKLVTSNADEVTAVLRDKIGMDYLAFFTSVFARQKELNALSVMKAAERKKLVLRMLGIERIEQSIQKIREDKRGKEKRIDGIRAALIDKEGRKKLDVLTGKQEDLEQEHAKLMPIIAELEAATRGKDAEVVEAKRILEIATKTYEAYIDLSTKLSGCETELRTTRKQRTEKELELSELSTKVSRLDAIAGEEAHYFQVRDQKGHLEAQREQYQRKQELEARDRKTAHELQIRNEKLQGLREQFNACHGVENELGSVKAELDTLQKQKERLHTALGARKSQILQVKQELEEQTRKRKRIADLGPESDCPLCERTLGTHYEALLAKLECELDSKRNALESLFSAYKREKEELALTERAEDAQTKELSAQETRMTELHALEMHIAHEAREVTRWQTERASIQSELSPLKRLQFDPTAYKDVLAILTELEVVYRELLGLRAETKRIAGVEQAIHALAELEETTERVKTALQQHIADLGFNKQDYELKKAAYERTKEELSDSKLALLAKRNELENVRREANRVSEEIAEQQRLVAEQEKEAIEVSYLSVLEQLMTEFKLFMVGRIRPMLSDYASDMLRRLTDGKYSTMELDENYDIYIYDDGTAYELNRFSGGEEDLANL
ncbi:MAG: SMC family ATPase, partial [Methanomicrobia archaeon]|nr:SMC family ATPase [Methanomicrobia archaeon]